MISGLRMSEYRVKQEVYIEAPAVLGEDWKGSLMFGFSEALENSKVFPKF